MNIYTELNLAEAATQLGTSVGKLMKCGAHGKLTISVVANDWPIRTENETAETIGDLVALTPDDLLQSYGADFTRVRKIVTLDEGETVTLIEPVDLLHGRLYVTAEEFRRFRDKYGGVVSHAEEIPPYLDSSHQWYSPELATAVESWMAHFADTSFDPGNRTTKSYVEHWLTAKIPGLSGNAFKRIATLVNPKKSKKGGTPPTLVK